MEFLLNLLSLVEAPLPTIEPTVALAVLAALVGVPGVLAGRPLLRRLEMSWLRKPPSSLEDLFGNEAAAAARAGDQTAFLNAVARAKKASVITFGGTEATGVPGDNTQSKSMTGNKILESFMREFRRIDRRANIVLNLSDDDKLNVSVARLIAKSLLAHQGHIVALVPFRASGNICLLALAAHEIVMSEDSTLVFDETGIKARIEARRLKRPHHASDVTLIDWHGTQQVIRETNWLAGMLLRARKAKGWRRIAKAISTGQFHEGQPARIDDLRRWGLRLIPVDLGDIGRHPAPTASQDVTYAGAGVTKIIKTDPLPVCAESCPIGETRDAMTALEQRRGTRLISIIHAPFAMTSARFDPRTALEALRAVRATPSGMDIDIILHTPGGDALAADQIVRALKAHRGRKTFFVPYHAFSAGTVLALTGDEIFMSPRACLGPIDVQFSFSEDDRYSAAAIASLLSLKRTKDIHDFWLREASEARSCIRDDHKKALAAMKGNYPRLRAERIARTLNAGYLSHGFPLMYEEARMTGLHVRLGVPDEVFTIVDSFLEGSSRFCSVIHCPT